MYTTLDPNLQHDAAEAVRIGMEEADKRIKGRKKKDPNYPDPQCALIALDPQTGEVRAAHWRAELRHQPAEPDIWQSGSRVRPSSRLCMLRR